MEGAGGWCGQDVGLSLPPSSPYAFLEEVQYRSIRYSLFLAVNVLHPNAAAEVEHGDVA
jgi:hypothetical protein